MPASLVPIERFSQRLYLAFWLLLLSVPLLFAANWFLLASPSLPGAMSNCPTPQLTPYQRVAGFASGLPLQLLVMAAIWQLLRLFDLYRKGSFFSLRHTASLRRLGGLFIASVALSPLSDALQSLALTWRNPPGQREISFGLGNVEVMLLFLGLALLAIAHVMEMARRHYEDNSLTV
ncbi:DUF2975 domain-containing protein [Paludibacterium yongneupense]|uniref:DUF2975 domain-containing protein n=1 Tax=Paludibacterium yongneupense TaxID=400061 RepID=UPI00040B6B54|nr:DUF2975 domain-containing protein [Paludibacterium yongneupense]